MPCIVVGEVLVRHTNKTYLQLCLGSRVFVYHFVGIGNKIHDPFRLVATGYTETIPANQLSLVSL